MAVPGIAVARAEEAIAKGAGTEHWAKSYE